ncbi:enoyl-CoA hydratase [Sphingomonas panacis]|uniref:Enoyl-CoA hydratase n=1 Tax=Sphingomonas panacis TaxID=1560345 RepID=A0A1B3Z6X6_9SPHN|nr:enoyl-CoA hydratase-related protein [Sphingomonas panacis]AOH83170.1 enoyl-CoA hydratase [Sphingomonas panacis]
MSYEFVEVAHEGALTIVTINRPASHNALHSAAQKELAAVFDAFASDDSQWVAIITGAGPKAFCAGHDIRAEPVISAAMAQPPGFGGLASRFDLAKPVIAAVNGVAMGGGFEIVLACDLAVASANAVFALPEPRVGLAALAGGIQRLPHMTGLKRAMDLLLTGRRISAREAFELGLINEVVEDDVLGAAKRWAADILACSPMSVRATKEATLRGLATSVEDGLLSGWGYPAMEAMLGSADAVEGPLAFAEKRAPVWKGR